MGRARPGLTARESACTCSDDAVRRGLLVAKPAQLAHSPKSRRPTSPTARAWSAPQLRSFPQHTKGHRHHAAFWLAANTGLRRSELLALRWSDLDLDDGRLSMNGGLVSVAYELHETHGKTRSSRRCIDLDRPTVVHLRRWQRCRLREHAGAASADAYLFAAPDGSLCIRRCSATRSADLSRAPVSHTSASTTCATRTPRCSSRRESRSRS